MHAYPAGRRAATPSLALSTILLAQGHGLWHPSRFMLKLAGRLPRHCAHHLPTFLRVTLPYPHTIGPISACGWRITDRLRCPTAQVLSARFTTATSATTTCPTRFTSPAPTAPKRRSPTRARPAPPLSSSVIFPLSVPPELQILATALERLTAAAWHPAKVAATLFSVDSHCPRHFRPLPRFALCLIFGVG